MKTIIAANWKMHKNQEEAKNTAKQIKAELKTIPNNCEVIIFPPFTAITATKAGLGSPSQIDLGAQNFYPAPSGAFTGEISIDMIKDAGASWVLIGHSERRHIFGEEAPLIAKKTIFALEQNMHVLLCIGETEPEREQGALKKILQYQLETALTAVPEEAFKKLVIAYEPVWAIGTGKVASSEDIIEAHSMTRDILYSTLGKISKNIRILYGGSVKPENAASILLLDNVNGLLVGGASLEAKNFIPIIQAGISEY